MAFKQLLLATKTISASENTNSALLKYVDNYAVQVIITASAAPDITVVLEASNDNSNFDELAGTSTSIGADGNFVINAENTGYKYVRAAITRASGNADLKIIIAGKERRLS